MACVRVDGAAVCIVPLPRQISFNSLRDDGTIVIVDDRPTDRSLDNKKAAQQHKTIGGGSLLGNTKAGKLFRIKSFVLGT